MLLGRHGDLRDGDWEDLAAVVLAAMLSLLVEECRFLGEESCFRGLAPIVRV